MIVRQIFFALEYSSGLSNHNIDTVTTEERKLGKQQRTGDNQGNFDTYNEADRHKERRRPRKSTTPTAKQIDKRGINGWISSQYLTYSVLLVCKEKREDRERTQGTAIKTIQMNNEKK